FPDLHGKGGGKRQGIELERIVGVTPGAAGNIAEQSGLSIRAGRSGGTCGPSCPCRSRSAVKNIDACDRDDRLVAEIRIAAGSRHGGEAQLGGRYVMRVSGRVDGMVINSLGRLEP